MGAGGNLSLGDGSDGLRRDHERERVPEEALKHDEVTGMPEPQQGRELKLTVVPVNGWGNRLRAMASCWMLSSHIGADFRVAWRDEPGVFVGDWSTIFAPTTRLKTVDYAHLRTEFQIEEELPPQYLSEIRDGRVTLRGHDLGEQCFIPELLDLVNDSSVRSVAIVAGNHFEIHPDAVLAQNELLNAKRELYTKLEFSPDIESQVESLSGQDFRALHLRHGDRRDWAPSDEEILKCLEEVVQPVDQWVVVGDDHREVRKWVKRLRRMGSSAFSLNAERRARSSESDTVLAIVEWRALTMARDIVHFEHSSFSTEAAVLVRNSGGQSITV